MDVRMALHGQQGGSDNIVLLTHNHSYTSSCKLQLRLFFICAATYLGMVMWEWCCVITATFYVYFVDQFHLYLNKTCL